MKVCYIAHPYTAGTDEEIRKNIRQAEEFGKQLALAYDYAVIIPHNNTEMWQNDSRFETWSHNKWMSMCLSIMAKCDVVAFCGKWVHSEGCRLEHSLALAMNKEILYIDESI